jgi:hypothetical protein
MKWTETTRTQCIDTRIVTNADIRANPLGIHPLRREVDLYKKIVRFCHYADPCVDHYLSAIFAGINEQTSASTKTPV